MPNTKAKDRKRFKRKLNDNLKKYGRTKQQIKNKLKKLAEKEKYNGSCKTYVDEWSYR